MEPKKKLDDYITFDDPVTMDNTGAVSGGYSISDGNTVTLSKNIWDTTNITGSYSYPSNTISTTSGPYTISSGTGINSPWYSTTASSKINLTGEDADIEINGKSLMDMIEKIEERLNILTPNEKLEAEWEELRELGNQYRKLEQHIKDKQATWDKLKAMPPLVID
jgi:hypothetical protein